MAFNHSQCLYVKRYIASCIYHRHEIVFPLPILIRQYQVHYQYFTGNLQPASISLSIAIRLLYAFEAHKGPNSAGTSGDQSSYDKNKLKFHLRDLFWYLYSIDKDISLRTGQPPTINDDDCDLTLPENFAREQDVNLQRTSISIDKRTLPLFPWDPRLSKIKSEAYSMLYSSKALRKSDSDILSSIRSLDDAIEQWRMSLHPDFRPTLCFSDGMRISAQPNTQSTMLRLAYYHCITVIHQACGRWTLSSPPPESKLDVISSCIAIAVNASLSTLSYLKVALPVIEGECFW